LPISFVAQSARTPRHVLVLCYSKLSPVLADEFVFSEDDCRCPGIDAGGQGRGRRQNMDAAVGVAITLLDDFAFGAQQIGVLGRRAAGEALAQILRRPGQILARQRVEDRRCGPRPNFLDRPARRRACCGRPAAFHLVRPAAGPTVRSHLASWACHGAARCGASAAVLRSLLCQSYQAVLIGRTFKVIEIYGEPRPGNFQHPI
jgi:hypothetical protein